jgi:DNA-binding PadR family transcriptional regulator
MRCPPAAPSAAESLKGHLDGLLLAVLEPGPLHGYAVIEALRAGSGGRIDLPTGTIYPTLHRLERAGLVRSHWSSGPGAQAAHLRAHTERGQGAG